MPRTTSRCPWAKPTNAQMIAYHDTEWGVPVHDDRRMFEFIVLESFQAGLSWEIILRKRDAFRRAFCDFDPKKVAVFREKDVERLMGDAGIVRNKKKIEATISNAKAFLEIAREHGSFCTYLWALVGGKPIVNSWKEMREVPPVTPLAESIAKDLKVCGFKFMGPTVVYAHLQATGLVNDHLVSCPCYPRKKH